MTFAAHPWNIVVVNQAFRIGSRENMVAAVAVRAFCGDNVPVQTCHSMSTCSIDGFRVFMALTAAEFRFFFSIRNLMRFVA